MNFQTHEHGFGRIKLRVLGCCAVVLGACLPVSELLAANHEVRIISDYENLRFVFEPATITINPGDTVTWVNDVAEEHNVITYPGGYPAGANRFQSPYMTEAQEQFTHTFSVEGTYQYHCLPHLLMGMKGEVVVGRRSTLAEFHTPNRDEIAAYRNQLLEWFDDDVNLLQVRVSEKPLREKQTDHDH